VSISLSFPGGNRYDPAGKEGLADMVAGLLTKGAGSRTAEQISDAIEGAGGSLGAGAGPDFLTISATVLTPSLPLAFELVADAVARPTFPASELELLRTQTLSGLQVALSQPGLIADRAFRHELYGTHPYGASPSPASTKAITRDDLVAFHRNRIRPSGALLVLAGDIDLATATRLATSALKGWTGTPATVAAPPAPTRAHGDRAGARASPRLGAVEHPRGKPDSSIRTIRAGTPRGWRTRCWVVARTVASS
jgi:zinc protease